jgi:geranylgeranyl reductase
MRRVAIIGGGPAGARVAWRLADAGLAPTLFEPRTRFEKPCGGGIPARGLDTFPFLHDPRLPARRVAQCVIIAPSGRRVAIRLAEPLLIFRRSDLHEYLLDRAVASGAALVAERVLGFSRGTAGWSLESGAGDLRRAHGPFDFLVAADGAGGFARRRLTRGVPAAELSQGLGYYLPGVDEEKVTLRFYPGLDGYLWVFPRLDHAAVGICDTLGRRPAVDLRALVDRFIRERYGAAVMNRAIGYAALIPGAPPAIEDATLQGDGWALVGDSGQAVDPLTREGIYFALVSADLLADAIAAGRPTDYAPAWVKRMAPEFAWAARHAGRFFEPTFIERLVRLTDRSPHLAGVVADLISGRQPYRTLRRRLLMAAPLVAWQAARRWSGPMVSPARDS